MEENTNVHVSELPAEIDDSMLAQIFGHYGTVTWSKILPNFGDKPTNAAIVEYASMEEARFVVENVNGNIPHGLSTPIQVSFKRSGRGGSKGGGGYGGKGGGGGCGGYGKAGGNGQSFGNTYSPYGGADEQKPMPPQRSTGGRVSTLFMGGLPDGVCEQELNMFFSGHCMGFERLKFVTAVEGRAGMAWAKFVSPEHAEAALTTITSGVSLPSCPQFTLRAEMARNDLDVTPGGPGMHPQHVARNPQYAAQQYSGQQPQQQQAPMAVTDGSGGCDTMFMGSLPPTVTDEELNGALMTVPGFVRCKLVGGQGEPRPVAFVLFDSPDSCAAAISVLNGAALPSAPQQPISCEFSKNSLDKRQRFG